MPLRVISLRLISCNSHNLNSCSNGYASTTCIVSREITLFYHVYASLGVVVFAISRKIRDTARRRVEIFAYDSDYRISSCFAGAINKSFLSDVSTVPQTFNFAWKNPIFNPIVIKFLEKEAPSPLNSS